MQEIMASLAAGISTLNSSAVFALLMGAFGALVKDISDDGSISLPAFKEGKFYIGFLGGVIIGAAAGLLTSGDILTEFLAGFAGLSVISSLIAGKNAMAKDAHEKDTAAIAAAIASNPIAIAPKKELPQDTILRVCALRNVDPKLALAVAEAESSFNDAATHSNADGSVDRGLFQINSKYHPEISADDAFNAEFATNFFLDAVAAGNLSWWNASKPKWIDKVFTA